ncbi:MAG: cupin domain-containing protein [Polaromonas sp.]|nr:cupin domain-containing protein [Polaromonas sp.]
MKANPIVRLACAAALVAVFGQSPGSAWADGSHRMVVAKDLKWADVPSLPPGAKISVIEGPMSDAVPFTVRLKFPANYQIPAHMHPAVERVTVLSGVFHMGTGDKFDSARGMPLNAGDMMIMVANSPHFAWTKEETTVQLHGTGPWGVTYINPADDPRKKP